MKFYLKKHFFKKSILLDLIETPEEMYNLFKNEFMQNSNNIVEYDDAFFSGMDPDDERLITKEDWYFGRGLYNSNLIPPEAILLLGNTNFSYNDFSVYCEE